MLIGAGLNAPVVLARNAEEGYLLLSDLGSETYLAKLSLAVEPTITRLYDDALHALIKMQRIDTKGANSLPQYDAALLAREMALFPEWFIERHLQLPISAATRTTLDGAFKVLSDSALSQPAVFVHRDYHSRNLMVSQVQHGPNPGVLDFQDAVVGPVTYDLVSLLRDCYIDWPQARVQAWALSYRDRAVAAGIIRPVDDSQWLEWFDLMGVQRHLKAIGIFARLWHRDGKRGYLADIPRTLGYVQSVASRYASLHGLRDLIETKVLPALNSPSAGR